MNQVAREVALAKGTLYLYFQTKEELFLALLTEHYQAWSAQLCVLLDERAPQTPDEVADAITESLRGYGAMRRLQLLLGGVLGGSELAVTFQQQMQAMMQATAPRLPYPHATAMRVLMHTDALCVGWQHLSEQLSSMDSQVKATLPMVDAEQEIRTSLRALLRYLGD